PAGADVTASATITVVCTPRVAYAIALHAGEQGDTTSRRLRVGATRIEYELYQDAGRRVVWGDRGFANTYPRGEVMTGIGTGATQTYPVFAVLHVPSRTAPTVGTYTDALIVTIHF